VLHSKKGELRFDDLCLEGNPNDAVKLQKCFESNKKQIWNYDNNSKVLKHVNSGQCMTAEKENNAGKLILAPCEEPTQPKQQWHLENSLFKQ